MENNFLGRIFPKLSLKYCILGYADEGGSIWVTERQLHSFLNERMILKNITLTYNILHTVFPWPKVVLDKKSPQENSLKKVSKSLALKNWPPSGAQTLTPVLKGFLVQMIGFFDIWEY